MWVLGGILGASLTSAATWMLAGVGTRNLPAPKGYLSLSVVLLVAALAGFLAGAAIVRRAGRTRDHLALFSCLAGGICGGLVGGAYAVTLTAAYLSSYATWPEDRFDQILVVLSYPAFGGLGFWIGAFIGLFLGLVFGSLLRIVVPAQR